MDGKKRRGRQEMRYRIFSESGDIIETIMDRPTFDNRFHGVNASRPTRGDFLQLESGKYSIIKYKEYAGRSKTENEFHEIESDWFADVTVVVSNRYS